VITSISVAVKDLKGKVLLEPHQDISDWARKTVFTSDYQKKKTKFKESSQLLDDISLIFKKEPYKTILEKWAPNFREWLGEIWAPSIVFDELKAQRLRDPYGYAHTLTIAVVGSRLLELWVTAAPTVKRSFVGLLLHDLGKTRVGSAILDKPGELDSLERQAIHEHPLVGFALNSAYWGDSNHLCAQVALHHHEDRTGGGYPRKIKTNSLILDILAIVDRFDALISERPFRYKKHTVREAFDILKKDTDDGRYEPDVLKALIALVRREKISDRKKMKLGTIGRPPKAT